MKIRLVTVTWGRSFTDIFLRLTARSLLAEGNLAALAARHAVAYSIHTTADDAAMMRASPVFARLEAAAAVELTIFDPTETDTRDLAIHWLFWRRSAEVARCNGEILFLIIPDMLFATGTLQRWAGFFEQGYRAVWTSVPQAVLETGIEEVEARFPPSSPDPISLDVRAVHRLLIRHIHPYMICMFRDSGRRLIHPEIVIADVPGAGMAMRALASHLFCIDPGVFSMTEVLSPVDHLELIAFDECRGVCLERMLKHANLHYRPARMDDTRLSNIGEWVDRFCSPSDMLESYHDYRLHWLDRVEEQAFRQAGAALSFFASQARLTGALYRVLRKLRSIDCHMAAEIVAAAHYIGRLRRHWRTKGAVTVVVPNNAALIALSPVELEALLAPGNEKVLVKTVLAHVFAGSLVLRPGDRLEPAALEAGVSGAGGATLRVTRMAAAATVIAGPVESDDCTIYVIDRPLWLPLLHRGARAHAVLPNRWSTNALRIPAPAVPPRPVPVPQAPRRDLRRLVRGGLRRAFIVASAVPALRQPAAAAVSLYQERVRRRWIAAGGVMPLLMTRAAPAAPPNAVQAERFRVLQMAQVALNLAEILRFYNRKMAPLNAGLPPLQVVEDFLHSCGLSEERLLGELKRLAAAAPDFAEAWLELGQLHLDRGEVAQAGHCFDRSLAGRLWFPAAEGRIGCGGLAAFGKAQVLAAQGKVAAAAEAFQSAFAFGFRSSMMQLAYAGLLRRLGRFREALVLWEAALDTDFTMTALPPLPRDFAGLAEQLRAGFGAATRRRQGDGPSPDAAAVRDTARAST